MLTVCWVLLAALLLWCAACLVRRRMPPLSGERGQVTQERGLLTTGVVGTVFFAACAGGFMAALQELQWVLMLFMAASVFLVQACCLWRIRWHGEGFEVRTAFGRTHALRWTDIIGLNDEALVTEKGCFNLDRKQPGCGAFIAAACRALDVPELPHAVSPRDPFRGRVKEPTRLLLGYLIPAVIALCAAGWVFAMMLQSSGEPGLQQFLGWTAAGCALMAAGCCAALVRTVRIGREPERYAPKIVARWIAPKHFRVPVNGKEETKC